MRFKVNRILAKRKPLLLGAEDPVRCATTIGGQDKLVITY